jgi:hypothetical protein
MIVTFFDRQNGSNPLNGSTIRSESLLLQVFDELKHGTPFFCELIAQNGYKALFGIGHPFGCVQYSRVDGCPPYLMAIAPNHEHSMQYIGFWIGNTLTPIPSRYCMPFELVKEIAAEFLRNGGRSASVSWEEI